MGKTKVSVVVTVKDDALGLAHLLADLDQQTHPPEEVVLAVATSTDATWSVAQRWQPRSTTKVVLDVRQATRAQGRNHGVAAAKSPIIAFTDAGCRPTPAWLEELARPFAQNAKLELVSGFTWVKAESSWQEALAPFVLVPFHQISSHPLPATRNMAIRKATFIHHQGFQPELQFAEDYEFARRLQAAGVESVFVPQAKVYWQGRSNLLLFANMIFHLTKGDIKANTLRLGHFTMWLRYALLLLTIAFLATVFSPGQAAGMGAIIYANYLILKTLRFSYQKRSSYLLAPLLQLVTDMAVLSGTFSGLLERIR